MAQATRTFRVFVSSTFSDLKEERNALQERVFPRLRELCMQHGARFQAIDLRWGVSEQASLDQQTMNICLGEIARCQKTTPRPNFIVLLGDRYGWRPPPPQIPATEFDGILERVPDEESALLREWYRRDENAIPPEYCLQARERGGEYEEYEAWAPIEARLHAIPSAAVEGMDLDEDQRLAYVASATHQEIAAGALQVEDAPEHVFCFFRRIEGLPQDRRAKDFLDLDEKGEPDSEAVQQLERLKDKLRRLLPGNVHEYEAKWTGRGVTTEHIEQLCKDVYESLSRVILEEIARLEEADPLEKEISAHEAFREDRGKFFIGRAGILRTIREYVKGTDPHPLVVWGKSGSGKSALMARAVQKAREDHPNVEVVFRFIGATPESSSGWALLESLCRQISRPYGAEKSTVPGDYNQLIGEFPQRLALATAEKPLILFLDAVDQLSDADNARNLVWLPGELPEHVRLVVSTLPGESLSVLEGKLPVGNLVELEPMPPEEGSQLLDLWLEELGRTLQEHQREEVLGKFDQEGNGLPLYLKLAFEEAQRWKSYSDPWETTLQPDVSGVIRDLFARLSSEAHHGQMVVSRSLGYLGVAKNGLSEDELLDVLSSDEEVFQDFLARAYHRPPEERLPVVVWSRFYFDLEPYLTERSADGTSLMTFYHRQLGEVVAEDYLAGKEKRERHRALARYFGAQALHIERDEQKAPNLRKLSELPYQQAYGEAWEKLEATLCDLQFVEAKCNVGMLFDLLRDCDRAIGLQPLPAVAQMRKALSLALSSLSARPTLAVQSVYNRLIWFDTLEPQLRERLETTPARLDRRGFWIRAEAPLPGSQTAGTVFIPFGMESSIQSLSPDKKAIAVASLDGAVEIRDLAYGELLYSRHLDVSRIVAIALSEDARSLAYMDADGVIRSDQGRASLAGRRGERLLVCHPTCGVVAVRADHALVAWHPARDEAVVLATDLPAPLVALRTSPDSPNILYVAGFKQQTIGVAKWTDEGWETKPLPYNGPPVVDADLDSEGKQALMASVDRQLRILDTETGRLLAQLHYEAREDAIIRGAPEKCAFGVGNSIGWAFFATRGGYTACWNWNQDVLERLEDWRPLSEPGNLIHFAAVPASGHLFFSTENSGKTITRQSLHQPLARHSAPVTRCLITDSKKVVSASELDHSVRWFSAEGLRPLTQQSHRGPTAITQREDTEDVIIGTHQGFVWNQPPDAEVDQKDIFRAFAEPVVSLFSADHGTVVAAGKSGRVLRIHLFTNKVETLWHSTGFQTQRKILPARDTGLFWSLRSREIGKRSSVVSLVRDVDEEEVALTALGLRQDVAVTRDGATICVAGESVQILRRSPRGWTTVYRRDIPVHHVTFLCEDDLLAVVLPRAPWLEVWSVTHGLPTVAAVDLPGDVSCLSAMEDWIVIGFLSGDLMSIRLRRGSLQTEDQY